MSDKDTPIVDEHEQVTPPDPRDWFGHPRGLFYLFFAELWERFSFYGMRALLTLYMTLDLFKTLAETEGEPVAKAKAFGIYAAYGALVYTTPVLGGRIADKLIGYRKSIMLGAVLMALGHFVLAIEHPVFFYGALALLIVGNGFFKPNISSMVGNLYSTGDPRRDAGFTIFYMGINIGAWGAPLLCGWLGQEYGWHYGFGLAGIGMLTGLLIFWRGQKSGVFLDIGFQPEEQRNRKIGPLPVDKFVYLAGFLVVPLFGFLVYQNDLLIGGMGLMSWVMNVFLLGGIIIYLIFLMTKVSLIEMQRMLVVVILTVFLTAFWAFFEQAGSSLTLFAEESVNLVVLNASQTNSINPGYIILLAIPFSLMWVALSKKGLNPITPIKFALGIAQLGLGFLIFAHSAQYMDAEGRVPMLFLMIGYLFVTTGELFVSPIGLSKTTELSPSKYVGFMMGVFFLSSAFAHHIAGFIAKLTTGGDQEAGQSFWDPLVSAVTGLDPQGEYAVEGVRTLANYTTVFTQIAVISFVVAIMAFILTPLLKKWMHGVH